MFQFFTYFLVASGIAIYLILFIELCKFYIKNLFPGNGTGSGFQIDNEFYHSIKLKRKEEDNIIGKGFHRSGWPKVIDSISVFDDEDGILFDDFVEQTFCYSTDAPIYGEPWIGVFHHPDDIPYFGNSNEKLQNLFNQENFKESLKNLKLAIALSEKLGNFLEKNLNCKVLVLNHPIEIDKFKEWSFKKWNDNRKKKLIQIGFYQRNTQLYNQVPKIEAVEIKRIWRNQPWTNDWDNKIKNFFSNKRTFYNLGTDLNYLVPSKFDEALSENVIMTEYVSVSASNVILDCISRNCPLFVNPKPEVVEYLGKDYPLYFENPEEIPQLFNKIEEAHIYLKNMNKQKLTLDNFCDELITEIKKIKK
jgi:hypothetical protein